MYLDCEGLYEIFIALAILLIAGCHLPSHGRTTRPFLAGGAIVCAFIALVVAILC